MLRFHWTLVYFAIQRINEMFCTKCLFIAYKGFWFIKGILQIRHKFYPEFKWAEMIFSNYTEQGIENNNNYMCQKIYEQFYQLIQPTKRKFDMFKIHPILHITGPTNFPVIYSCLSFAFFKRIGMRHILPWPSMSFCQQNRFTHAGSADT